MQSCFVVFWSHNLIMIPFVISKLIQWTIRGGNIRDRDFVWKPCFHFFLRKFCSWFYLNKRFGLDTWCKCMMDTNSDWFCGCRKWNVSLLCLYRTDSLQSLFELESIAIKLFGISVHSITFYHRASTGKFLIIIINSTYNWSYLFNTSVEIIKCKLFLYITQTLISELTHIDTYTQT